MHPLHLSKVAVGCSDLGVLAARNDDRVHGGEVHIHTRYRPKRHEELIGGSLYWIIKHRLVARQAIVGFGEDDRGHCLIRLEHRLVLVRQRPKGVHQGWRYLEGARAPADHDGGDDDVAELPARLAGALSSLGLI